MQENRRGTFYLKKNVIFQISLGRHYALKIKPRDSEAKRANVKQEGGFAAVALGLNY